MTKLKSIRKKEKKPPMGRWERSAARENDRRWKKAPLFVHAGLIPLATPAEREARFGEAFRAELERADAERKQIEKDRGDALREEVRQLVSPEKFAELQERESSWPSAAAFYSFILKEMASAEKPAAPAVEEAPAPRPPAAEQAVLFVEVQRGDLVPTVEAGRAIPLETIAAAHGIDMNAPEYPPPPPCVACGWVATPAGQSKAIDLNVHPWGCPAFRAFLLGLSERCEACKAKRYSGPPQGPCEAHLARTLACALEGCIPGPSKWDYLTGEYCQRCWCSMEAAPYFARAA